MRSVVLLAAAADVAALTIGAGHHGTGLLASQRVASVRMQFDEEGGMVKGIEEGGQSFDDFCKNYGKEDASLPADKKAMLVLPEAEWNVAKMAVSATDEDFELTCSAMGDTELTINVEPMMNTYEEYFYGFTADSDPMFRLSADESDPIEGKMQRRGGEATKIKVKCDPNGAAGEFVAHLGFILPEEKTFSKWYKLTLKTT